MDELKGFVLYDLKEECTRLGVSKVGKKAELIERIIGATPSKSKAKAKPSPSPSMARRGRSKTPLKITQVVVHGDNDDTEEEEDDDTEDEEEEEEENESNTSPLKSIPSPKKTPKKSPKRTPSLQTTDPNAFTSVPYVLFFESSSSTILTPEGASHIASHKYVSGSSTIMDTFFDAFWTKLTTYLPMSMAPNTVTTIGFLHCLLSYLLIYIYCPSFSSPCPPWLLLLNAYTIWAYYTFDCMDGKQARRTGSSSSLGQLFDHGIDCICNMSHFSCIAAIILPGATKYALGGQFALQVSFFVAQWQEYHTRSLPHKFGQFGVTEINHMTSLFSLFSGVFYSQDRWAQIVDLPYFGEFIGPLKLNEVFVLSWIALNMVLISTSLFKTVLLPMQPKALLHLFSPVLLACTVFVFPDEVVANEARGITIAVGLCFSLITNKVIVYSMGKMTFAVVQLDVLPVFFTSLLIRHAHENALLTAAEMHNVILGVGVWSFCRLGWWCYCVINELCEKLDINCFTIKDKGGESESAKKSQ